jgi:repressor of nif and glnA expression
MVTRKAKVGKKIEASIIKVLNEAETPISTREIALKIGRAWNSVQNHCFRMQLRGEIMGFRISNLNVWVIKK